MNQSFLLRQLDIADLTRFKDKTVTVIGAGGIGAATVVALAKTGFENITVYDFDTVEEHNLPNQLLPMWVGDQDTLTWKKTTALFHLVHDLADIAITPVNERYTDQPLGEIVIFAVDSVDARRSIWGQLQQSMDTLFFLDGRMAITSMDLYAIDIMSEEAAAGYTETLTGKAEELPCTARATMFNSFIIAGHLVALLVAYLNSWQYPWRFYYNVRSFQTLPVHLLQKAA
jgi:NAD(P)-dependent dehydrogenase (short-subunit alcohol dehydrogenase family)